jgi:hypothetical protein
MAARSLGHQIDELLRAQWAIRKVRRRLKDF